MLLQANALNIPLADNSVHCAITSPPYWGLRDYGTPGQLGLEATPDEYVQNMVAVFREVRRVLRPDGTCWLNLGDSYANPGNNRNGAGEVRNLKTEKFHGGKAHLEQRRTVGDFGDLKHKDLVGIPWRVAFALQADGWWLRSDIIWAKPNPMPESVTDRPTKAHEYLFLLAKSARYYYDAEAVKEKTDEPTRRAASFRDGGVYTGNRSHLNHADKDKQTHGDGEAATGRNRRSVWTIATAPYSGAHFATYPPALVEPCLLAGTSARGVCPACGAPWERVIENGLTAHDGATASAYADGTTANRLALLRQAARERGEEYTSAKKTVGWAATCACGRADTVPAIVLDPFNGSGTTGMVARKHGRRYVGLDISASYLRELALPRAEQKQTAASLAALPLFGGAA